MRNNKHSVEVVQPDLEIDEHLPLQEKGWVVQRYGWVFIMLVMVAGGLGAFGEGLLSKRTVIAGNTSAEYERYFRYETEMKVLVQSPTHMRSISLPGEYLKKFRVVRFVPEPVDNSTSNNYVRYNFLPTDNHIVSIYMIPKDYGSISGTMRVNETDNINLHHFIYP